MEYNMEELLPVVDKLTKKYTSNESSSITYETARMLMGAVLYCIEEYRNGGGNELPAVHEKLDVMVAYQCGYDTVIAKVYKTKEIYESITQDFRDFGCRNCRDTIIKGIPQFFMNYDPKFNPQGTILTLDYPTVNPIGNLCGVDAVYQYLCNIKIEWDFLNAFDTRRVESLLEKMFPDYRDLYLDNISNPVLLTCIGCMVAEKSLASLELEKNDLELIKTFFENDNVERAEQKIGVLIVKLFDSGFAGNTEMKKYFLNMSREYAFRIVNGIKNNSLVGML